MDDNKPVGNLTEACAGAVLPAETGYSGRTLNVNGGSISIGHPYGMTGAQCTRHFDRRQESAGTKYAVVTMCIGGQGAAGIV
jgi:acetyl-CoA acetyltransferase